jgi:hypothetical protein
MTYFDTRKEAGPPSGFRKSIPLGGPHLAVFEMRVLAMSTDSKTHTGRVLFFEPSPTFADPSQTWGTPRLKMNAPFQSYTRRENWATRPAGAQTFLIRGDDGVVR